MYLYGTTPCVPNGRDDLEHFNLNWLWASSYLLFRLSEKKKTKNVKKNGHHSVFL